MEIEFNSTIICVDDEEPILEAYKNTLITDKDDLSHMIQKRRIREGIKEKSIETKINEDIQYKLLFARSGEEAIEIVRKEYEQGRRIAAGFFDMTLPCGIDGMETIKRIRNMDSSILCAIVTAFTDHPIEQISKLFSNQDEWMYFNKPFTSGELIQSARNLVSSWNRRYREKIYMELLERTR